MPVTPPNPITGPAPAHTLSAMGTAPVGFDALCPSKKTESMQNMGRPYDESRIIGIEFYNRTSEQKRLWIEPSCIEVVLDSKTEYRVEADDMEYRIEFSEELIILYLQYRFGPKVYKRPYSVEINPNIEWILEEDFSDIN